MTKHPGDNCALCEAARSRRTGTHTGGNVTPTTCVPGYVVPIRSGPEASPWYFEDDRFWIGECEFCAVPVAVLNSHVPSVTKELRAAMEKKLTEVVAEHYKWDLWIDMPDLRMPGHFHLHARPLGRLFPHGTHRIPARMT